MTEGGCVNEFPHEIIRNQRLPLRVVVDERLYMLLQKVGSDRHPSLLVHLGLRRAKLIASLGAGKGMPARTLPEIGHCLAQIRTLRPKLGQHPNLADGALAPLHREVVIEVAEQGDGIGSRGARLEGVDLLQLVEEGGVKDE